MNFRDRLMAISQTSLTRTPTSNEIHNKMFEKLFDSNQNAQVVLNREGNLVIANELARNLFSLSTKDYGQPFHNFEVSYRPVDLRTPLDKAINELTPVIINEIGLRVESGITRCYDVRVLPMVGTDRNLLGIDIVFMDVTAQKTLLQQLEHTNQELETAMEELQSTIEELETTNEELQSANEELETMNEELQSTNQEMQTINVQLHQRNEAFNQLNGFLNAILEGISGSVVVLDPQMQVMVWSLKSEDFWGLRSSEVQNKHFLNLDIGLPAEKLTGAIRQCLADHSTKEEVFLTARNRRGKDISCKVVVTPLIGYQERIDGVILIIEERGG